MKWLAIDPAIRQLNLTSLRLYVIACEAGSLGRAAQLASITPSALSRRMRELEECLGLQLLIRTPEGIRPTDAGLVVQEHAQRLLADMHRMVGALQPYRQVRQGAVRVVVNQSSLDQRLSLQLARFAERFPHIEVSLEERKGADVRESLLSGYADLAIGNEWYLDEDGLDGYLYRRDRFVAIYPPATPAPAGPVKFDDMLRLPLIGLPKDSVYNRWLEERAATVGFKLQFQKCVSSFHAVCQLVSVGLGAGIVPQHVSSAAGSGPLVAVALDEDWAFKNVVVCRRDARALDPAAQALFDFLRQEVQEAS